MRKICWVCLLFFFIHLNAFAQRGIWADTLRTYVDLSHFNLGKKVVEAPYSRVVMYFSQKDYLGKEVAADTVRILPRFFNDTLISGLMKRGKVKIISRESDSVVVKISHRMVQYGSTVYREFELPDKTAFFSNLEIITESPFTFHEPTLFSRIFQKRTKIIPKKDFKEPEEFPNHKNHEKIKFRDYFTVDTTFNYVYNTDWDDYGDLDTIGCRQSVYEKQKIFYFPYKGYNAYNLVDIDLTMFGGGFYFYRNDSLFVVKAQYESDLKPDTTGLRFDVPDIKDAHLLMPTYMTPGYSIVVKGGDDIFKERRVYTYLGKDTVKIKNLTYYDCIKFKMIKHSDDEITISYIWFCKGIGMIKWTRETGRTDELVNRYKH